MKMHSLLSGSLLACCVVFFVTTNVDAAKKPSQRSPTKKAIDTKKSVKRDTKAVQTKTKQSSDEAISKVNDKELQNALKTISQASPTPELKIAMQSIMDAMAKGTVKKPTPTKPTSIATKKTVTKRVAKKPIVGKEPKKVSVPTTTTKAVEKPIEKKVEPVVPKEVVVTEKEIETPSTSADVDTTVTDVSAIDVEAALNINE